MGGVRAGAFAVVSGVCFGAVFVPAFGAEVRCGGRPVGHRDEMIEIAAVCGHGARRVRADPVPECDGGAEFPGGEAAQFGDVEQVALRVGE